MVIIARPTPAGRKRRWPAGSTCRWPVPRKYPGYVAQEKWIGDGRARATSVDIRRALLVLAVACLLDAGLVILTVIIQG